MGRASRKRPAGHAFQDMRETDKGSATNGWDDMPDEELARTIMRISQDALDRESGSPVKGARSVKRERVSERGCRACDCRSNVLQGFMKLVLRRLACKC